MTIQREIPFGRPMIGDEERKAVNDVLSGPVLVHGPKATEFEAAFCAFSGAPAATSASSCTTALHLSYLFAKLAPGDEVIVPAQTHVATAHAVEYCGATPVFVDAETETGNIDLDQLEAAITPRTKAVSVVHFLGMPVNMDRVMSIARKHNLFVVEDCALAFGTYFRGIHAGLFGDTGCFSFYPVKHITTAEGGMLISRRKELVAEIARKKAFGVDRTHTERAIPGVYDVTMLGYNFRLNEIAAAIGIEQLKKGPSILERRRENYELLESRLKEIDELTFLRSSHGDFKSSHYCLSVILSDALSTKRFELVTFLKEHGVGTSVYYPKPVPHLKYYREKYRYDEGSFPGAARISYRSIALPVGPHLGAEDILYIAETMKTAVASVTS